MSTQGIVADVRPFLTSRTTLHLKTIVAKRIQAATSTTLKVPFVTSAKLVANLEELGVFANEKMLRFALKNANADQGEISNQELIKLLLDQMKLQRIFTTITTDSGIENLTKTDIEFLMQSSIQSVQAFIRKYQTELEQKLAYCINEEIGFYLISRWREMIYSNHVASS